jgi:hypothetical protein
MALPELNFALSRGAALVQSAPNSSFNRYSSGSRGGFPTLLGRAAPSSSRTDCRPQFEPNL